MARKAPEVSLSEEQRQALEVMTRRRKTAQALATRARIVLMCAEGMRNEEVAGALGIDRATVGKWRRRFVERGVEGLHDEQRPGVPRKITDADVEAVIVRTPESAPRMRPTGVPAAWPGRAACRRLRSRGSGEPLV